MGLSRGRTTGVIKEKGATGPTLGHLFMEIRPLAKPNYSFEKRQREIAKKKQQDEKEARKRQAKEAAKAEAEAGSPQAPQD